MKLSAAIVMPAAEVTRIGSDENDTTVSIESLILRRNDHLETAESRGSRSYWGLAKPGRQDQTRCQTVAVRKTVDNVDHLAIEQAKGAGPAPRIGRYSYAPTHPPQH